jgi:threonine synthase
MKYELKCVTCGQMVAPTKQAATCPSCGPLKGTLDVTYPLETLKDKFQGSLANFVGCDVYRAFDDILPYDDPVNLPPLAFGRTPLFQPPRLANKFGNGLYLKDDGRNPSASFKDRASAVAIAMARESGANTIACASTGNAASSLATLAAALGMRTVVFIPKDAPEPKLTQILIHGAAAIRLDCDYDRAFDLCQEACEQFGWYNRNTAVNPFTGEGKKSAAIEIAVALGEAPDVVVCPVGDGCIIGGLHKGFSDLLGLGLIRKMPRLYGIQAAGAAPLVKAFENGGDVKPYEITHTVADSISVGCPRDGVKALRAVRNTYGAMVAVSDREILAAQRTLASAAGVFAEPAASAAYAGLLRLIENDSIQREETAVVVLTGHGLKDIETARNNIITDIEITRPDIDSVTRRAAKLI